MKALRLAFIICLIALVSATLFPIAPSHAAGDLFPALVKWPAKIAGGNPVTISITNKPPASDAIGLKEWQDEVDRFTKLYPNVTIEGNEYTYTPDSFAALVAGKQVPTMFQVYLT